MDYHIQLRDGRRLGVSESGDPDGTPVLFCHGLFGSRVGHYPSASVARAVRVRLVAVDRPGYGHSDPDPGRSFLSWAADVRELADSLALDRFAVVGWSGGGPYAAACALGLADRITSTIMVSSAGYVERGHPTRGPGRRLSSLAQRAPRAAELLMRTALAASRLRPDQFYRRTMRRLAAVDREIVARAAVKTILLRGRAEAVRNSTEGIYSDARLLMQPWGFDPAHISSRVHVWHGELDRIIPPDSAQRLARRIPHASLRLFRDAGHFLLYDYWRDMLRLAIDPAPP